MKFLRYAITPLKSYLVFFCVKVLYNFFKINNYDTLLNFFFYFYRTIILFFSYIILSENVTGTTLNCDYLTFGASYQCIVKNIPVIKSQTLFTNALGNHENLRSNDDVTWITISNGTMDYFPKGIDKIFKNLNGIRITNVDLKKIKQEDIKKFPKLKFLNLSFNKITKIEGNTFQFNPMLEHISLSNNEISHIGIKTFSDLKSLKQLLLKGNKCRNKSTNISAEDQEQVEKLVLDIEAGKCS